MHWVGAGVWGDPGDTPSEMRAIQAFASSPGKGTPWEYNFVVDAAGETWTYAGEFVAAHSAGENAEAIGVLMLAGIGESCPDAMVLALRQLRHHLVSCGALLPGHEMRPHQRMPGASTACPGPAVMARWSELIEPWSPPAPPPTLEEDDDVRLLYIARPAFEVPAGYDPAWFVVDGAEVRRAVSPDVALAAELGIPVRELDSADQYAELLRASGSAYPGVPS